MQLCNSDILHDYVSCSRSSVITQLFISDILHGSVNCSRSSSSRNYLIVTFVYDSVNCSKFLPDLDKSFIHYKNTPIQIYRIFISKN